MDFSKIHGAISQIGIVNRVDYATDMDYVGFSVETADLPAVFYYPYGKKASRNTGNVQKKPDRYQNFAIRIVCIRDQLDVLQEEIEDALVDLLVSDKQMSKISWEEGQVIGIEKKVITWRDIYTFKTAV